MTDPAAATTPTSQESRVPSREPGATRERHDAASRPAGSVTRRLIIIGLTIVVLAGAGAGGWIYVRPGSNGPLDAGSGSGVTLPGTPPGTKYAVGQLFVQNAGDRGITIQSVKVIPGGGGLATVGHVKVSGPERVDTLGEAGFVTQPDGPPAQMPLDDPAGYFIPAVPGQTVEIVYTVVTPSTPNSWINGIEITYKSGNRTYREQFKSVVSVCTPAFTGECPDHA